MLIWTLYKLKKKNNFIQKHKKKLEWKKGFIEGNDPGLPDGIFSNQKSQFGWILECLAMKYVGKFHDHLVYFTANRIFYGYIWYILWSFGIFCGLFGIFFPFWYVIERKIWQPCNDHSWHCQKRKTLAFTFLFQNSLEVFKLQVYVRENTLFSQNVLKNSPFFLLKTPFWYKKSFWIHAKIQYIFSALK
jgi:hypothetical protein